MVTRYGTRGFRHRLLAALASLMLLGLVASSCGGDGGDDEPMDATPGDLVDTSVDATSPDTGDDMAETTSSDTVTSADTVVPTDTADGETDVPMPVLVEHTLRAGDGYADLPFWPATVDGIADGSRVAVRLAAPGPAELTALHVPVTATLGDPLAPFVVRVYAPDGPDGGPGTELGTPRVGQLLAAPMNMLPFGARWVSVAVDPPIALDTDGVWAAVEWTGTTDLATAPAIGLDRHVAATEGYVFLPGEGWGALADALAPEAQPALPMIEATVVIDTGLVTERAEMIATRDARCEDYVVGMLPPGTPTGWAVSRLTPETWPFVVERVGYELAHLPLQTPACSALQPHRVIVFEGGETPPDSPTILESIDVALDPAEIPEAHAVIRRDLETPIRLEEGSHLYVGVEILAGNPTSCISICFPATEVGADFWADDAASGLVFEPLHVGLGVPETGIGDPTVKAWGYTP